MSNTDLEDDLRATFERAASSVPPVHDLSDRATTSAHQAQRRAWIISGAAAVAVAAIAVVGFGLAGSKDKPVQPPVAGGQASVASTPTPQPPTAQTVSGTWRPVQMTGLTTLQASRPDDPVLVLRRDGTWGGSDGCNALQGTYTIGPRGEFSATVGPQRLAECSNVPHTGVLEAANRITGDADSLQFFGSDGHQLAKYARAR